MATLLRGVRDCVRGAGSGLGSAICLSAEDVVALRIWAPLAARSLRLDDLEELRPPEE